MVSSGFGSGARAAIEVMVGRTSRITVSLSLTWGVTVMVRPMDTVWGVVLTEVCTPALVVAVWLLSTLKLCLERFRRH